MQFEQSRYLAYKRKLIVGFVLLLTVLVLALSWKLRASYLNDRRTAEVQTKNFVQAMDAHVVNVIEIVDAALMRSADALAMLEQDQLRNPNAVRQSLAASGRSPDTNYWLIFLDADGNGVVASNGLPIAGISYSDRPYFTAHAKGADTGLFVGEPHVGKVSQRRIFFVSRAVRSSTGRLLGVIAAPIDAAVLAGVFQNALFEPGLTVTLAHTDGKVIARAPRFEESFGSDITTSPLFDQLKNGPSGTYEATSIIDGTRRMFSYRSLVGLPLVISVGMASEAWTAGLIDDLLVAAVALGVILLILLVSGRFALSSFRRINASEAEYRLLAGDLRAAREELAHREERMRLVTDHVPALVSYIDVGQRYVFGNAAHAQIEGIDFRTMVGKTVRQVHGDAAYHLVVDEMDQALRGEPVVFERAVDVAGVTHHWKFAYTPDFVNGKVVGLYSVVTDMTNRRRVEQNLRSQARADALTGLPNRAALYERLEQAIQRCFRHSAKLACLYLDIDHLKQVNDSLGHASGDTLLRQFGARLQACVRATDLVARLAGDEFVVVIEGVTNASDAENVATKIVDAMQVPFTIDGDVRVVTASIGVIVSDGRDEDPDSVLKKADSQLYLAKRMGKNLYRMQDAVEDCT